MQCLYYCVIITAVGISVVETIYAIGSTASVTCFSNLNVQSIQWVDMLPDNSRTVVGDAHELILEVMSISRELDGRVFTCEVINMLPNGRNVTSRNNFTLNADEIRKLVLFLNLFLYLFCPFGISM